LIKPTIAINAAPETPLPPTWPTSAPMWPERPLKNGMRAIRSCPTRATTDRTRDRVPNLTEAQILGRRPCRIAADSSCNKLNDEIESHARNYRLLSG
jgi:hypothetical protein